MIMNKAFLLLLASAKLATATTRELDQYKCTDDLAVFQENAALQDASNVTLTEYAASCESLDLCNYSVSPDTEAAVRETITELEGIQSESDALPIIQSYPGPLIADTSVVFGGPSVEGESYKMFVDECTKTGGSVECVDVAGKLKGNTASSGVADYLSPFQVDLVADIKGLPVCLPASCDGQDLNLIADTLVKQLIMQQDDVKQAIIDTPEIQTYIELASVEFACTFLMFDECGLDVTNAQKCEWDVEEAPVDAGSSGSISSPTVLSMMVGVAALVFSM